MLGVASDGGAEGRVLWRTLLQRERRDTGGPTDIHHIQCGGGHGGPPLGVLGIVMGGGGQLRQRRQCGSYIREDDPGKRRGSTTGKVG